MMRHSRTLLIAGIVLALVACGETKSEKPADRGTQELPPTDSGTSPKGVRIDEAGRWSLASAPALDPATISPKNAMRPASTGDHLHVFFERPPTADEMTGLRAGGVTVDLVLRSFTSRLIVDHGCLRLDMPERPLVRFNAPPLLQRDPQGYLVLGGHGHDGRADFSRIGEEVLWFNGPFENDPDMGSRPLPVTDPEVIAPIHEACGPGEVVSVPATVQSVALYHAKQMDMAVKQFREMYGVDEATARRKMDYCRATGGCGAIPPPPPVTDAKMCPAATRLESGLCRNADSFVRPIP